MITFTSKYNLFDEVYALIDNVPTKCSIRKIIFPTLSRTNIGFPTHKIQYGLYPVIALKSFKTVSESDCLYEWRYSDSIGKTIPDLFGNLEQKYKNS